MSALFRIASLVVLGVLVGLVFSGRALAQAGRAQSIPVLAIDSDDSDEQADALTGALRSHVRQTPGWTLLETTQSLSMLTAAFQCPQRPDAACLARIGDKLKADQFFWGVMTKAPGRQVSVELHVWTRGRPDRTVRRMYSDNLKDANDDNLRKVATELFGNLLGAATGSALVQANVDTGTVLVDGVATGNLVGGKVTLTLAVGPHAFDVVSPGYVGTKRQASVDSSTPVQVQVTMTATAMAAAAPAPAGSTLPVRKIVGWSAIAGGVVLGAIGVGFGVAELNDQSDLGRQRLDNYQTGLRTPVADPCNVPSGIVTVPSQAGCNDVSKSHTALAVEITTLALGGVAVGVGAYLLLTDHPSSGAAEPAKTGLASVELLPSLGPGGASMAAVGHF